MGRKPIRRWAAAALALLLLCMVWGRPADTAWGAERTRAVLSAPFDREPAPPLSAQAESYTFAALTAVTDLEGAPVRWTSRLRLEYEVSEVTPAGGTIRVRLQVTDCTAAYQGTTRPVAATPIVYSGLTLAVGAGLHTALSRAVVSGVVQTPSGRTDLSVVGPGNSVLRQVSPGGLPLQTADSACAVLQALEGQAERAFGSAALLPLDTVGCRVTLDASYGLQAVGDQVILELFASYHDGELLAPPEVCPTTGAVWAAASAAADGAALGDLAMPVRQVGYTARL